jgi:hypothetical protein
MKTYNEFAVARMDSTSALLASLPQTFTAKEFNAIREKKAREDSGITRLSIRYIPRNNLSYSLDGLREIGAIVIAFSEPVQIEVETPIYEVVVRATGESLFIGTEAECDEFRGDDWKRLGRLYKGTEKREITAQRHHYSVNHEAYWNYIRETFGML